jgi:hypothetical protein
MAPLSAHRSSQNGARFQRCRPRAGRPARLLVQDSESSDSIAQMALQDRREDGLDRLPTQNESLTFAQLYLVQSSKSGSGWNLYFLVHHLLHMTNRPSRRSDNAVPPGVIETDMSNLVKTDEGKSFVLGMQALKRIGQPDDVGSLWRSSPRKTRVGSPAIRSASMAVRNSEFLTSATCTVDRRERSIRRRLFWQQRRKQKSPLSQATRFRRQTLPHWSLSILRPKP